MDRLCLLLLTYSGFNFECTHLGLWELALAEAQLDSADPGRQRAAKNQVVALADVGRGTGGGIWRRHWHEMALQPRRPVAHPMRTMLAQRLTNSLEALSNLLYPFQRSLDDPAKAATYPDLAEKVLIGITGQRTP
jgi:hypothetical protein